MAIATISERYELQQRLDSGGMGDVWLAHDTRLGRNVALKFVSDRQLRETSGAREILRDEARTAGSLLGVPTVVTVLDLFETDSHFHQGPVLVMEYVDGCNLAGWITEYRPRIQDEETRFIIDAYIGLQVAESIVIAHKRNMLHRDIKPQNVLVSRSGIVKVADFGLARLVEAITRSHTVWNRNTPLYAAPEQWNEEKPTKETDIYQLGGTLFHLFAGRPPCDTHSAIALMRWHLEGEKVDLSTFTPTLGSRLNSAINAALAKVPSDRPALWTLVDALSEKSMVPRCLWIDVSSEGDEMVKIAAEITDYGVDDLRKGPKFVVFPNPSEVLTEAIALLFAGVSNFKLIPPKPAEVEAVAAAAAPSEPSG